MADVLSRGLSLAAAGIALGLIGALLAGRAIASLTPGVSARDPVTLVACTVVLALVGTVGSLLPALGASRVDPAVTLSAE
mgnify:FL=1